MAKNKLVIKTGRGTAIYPHTFQPVRWDDASSRSVPDPAGTYDIQVALDAEPSRKLKAEIQAFAKAELKACKNLPFKPEVDKETGEETGRTLFKFKQYGTLPDGGVKRIPHFNVQGRPLAEDFRLNSGSTVIVKGRAQSYTKLGGGIRLLVDGIQVIVAAEYDSNMFDDESDGSETEQGEAPDSPEGFPDETGTPDF